jgi:copper chaperone CopZ
MMIKKSFPIVGMHCASCAKLIERSISKVPGVISCAVNYGSESAVVELQSDKVTERDLGKAVENAGYKAVFQEKNSNKTPEEVKKKKN